MDEYKWNLDGFISKVGFDGKDMQITQYIAEHIFQLDPPPPELPPEETINDEIRKALETKDLKYFSFFLHRFEPILNRYIRRTLANEANFQYDPEGFLEIKLCCMMTMLHLLPRYELEKKAKFSTFAHHYILNAIRNYQMQKESWSLPSLSTYKKIRTAAWMQKNLENAAEAFMKRYQCNADTAQRYFREADCLHKRNPLLYVDEENGVVEEAADEEASDMFEIFWNGVHANAVRKAFDRLSAKEKEYLQQKNAMCMVCGCARHISTAPTFDDLGAIFELTTAGGAEKAYSKAVEHLTMLMVEDNAIRTLTLKRTKVIRRKKKIAVAVYEYQADCDGEWGELSIDFEKKCGEILYLAELDTTRTHVYAAKAIEELLQCTQEDLPKKKMIAFPR